MRCWFGGMLGFLKSHDGGVLIVASASEITQGITSIYAVAAQAFCYLFTSKGTVCRVVLYL